MKILPLILTIYFVQGAVTIVGIAEFLLTKNLFQFSWIQLGLLGALATLAWSVKPIYGFLTDLLPICGKRRKYYLLIASLFSVLGYLLLGLWGSTFALIAFALVIANIGNGFVDVIADGMVVENASKKTVGKWQAWCWRSKAVGIFFGSLFAGIILERAIFSNLLQNSSLIPFLQTQFSAAFPAELVVSGMNLIDIRFTFLITALLPFLIFFLALFVPEKNIKKSTEKKAHKDISIRYITSAGMVFALSALILVLLPTKKEALLPFLENGSLASLLVLLLWSGWIFAYLNHLVRLKAATTTLLFSAAFLFLWRFTPSFGAPWNNYWLNDLQVSQEHLSYMGTLLPLAWIFGSVLYTKFFDGLPIKKVLFWTVIAATTFGLLELIVATPALGSAIGENIVIKSIAGVLLTPAYFMIYGTDFWTQIMQQESILNTQAVIAFVAEALFIIAFLPLLKLAALVTPKGVEASNFAILASIMNLGLVFGAISGGMIYQGIETGVTVGALTVSGLHIAILIGAVTSLLCLPLLRKMKV